MLLNPDDYSYLGGMIELEKMNLSVPGDVSAAAYDGIPMAGVLRPRLATWHQDAVQIGRLSARKLVEKIEHSQTCVNEEIPVSGWLIEGTSVADITGT